MIDNVSVDSRDAPAIVIGTVYGPLPTRISLGGFSVIRAGGADCCVPAPVDGAAGGVGAGGGTTGGGGSTTGATGAATGGGATGAVVIPGIGELPGGTTGRCELPVGNTGAAGG